MAPLIVAGWAQMKSFFKYKPGEWQKEIDVCLNGALNLAHTIVPDMIDKNQGKFINIVGDSARTGDRHFIVSGAARNGTIRFLKSLAKEFGKYNVQCNTVALGMIDQGLFEDVAIDKMIKQYPLKRLGNAKDVFGAIMFYRGSR